MQQFKKDLLQVVKSVNRKEMGKNAATAVAFLIKKLLLSKNEVNIIFAAAPSQLSFFESMIHDQNINWSRINAFHMDEYIGLPKGHPALFSSFLNRNLFNKVAFKSVHYLLNENEENITDSNKSYGKLLNRFPADIICLGIGENGHLAFNDPSNADFNDPNTIKVVELDEDCRIQQVNDGCFDSLAGVPTHAITLTIPMLMRGKHLCCIVPGDLKREAIKKTLSGNIVSDCPASILRTHPSAILFGDDESLREF